MNIIDKFWSYVDKTEDCWIWTGSCNSEGRCQFRFEGKVYTPRQLAWELIYGKPAANQLRRICQTPKCVNPKHFAEDLASRFWQKVDKTSNPDGCWNWKASKVKQGYGRFGIGKVGKTLRAHRVAWELTYGEIPEKMFVCHKCDNPSCVRPEHLFLGTCSDNILDAHEKGRGASNCKPQIGENNGKAKLTAKDVVEIRQKFATGNYSLAALGRQYGIHYGNIKKIVNRKHWTHVE